MLPSVRRTEGSAIDPTTICSIFCRYDPPPTGATVSTGTLRHRSEIHGRCLWVRSSLFTVTDFFSTYDQSQNGGRCPVVRILEVPGSNPSRGLAVMTWGFCGYSQSLQSCWHSTSSWVKTPYLSSIIHFVVY